MKTLIRKLLVGVAGLVLQSFSVSKEMIVRQRQQNAALRRVHKCERDLAMAQTSGGTDEVSKAQQQLNAAVTAFSQIYSPQ